MKKLKKLLSIALAVMLVVCAVPLATVTTNAESYSGSCGDSLTWEFDSNTGELIIFGSGAMTDWILSSYAPWYTYRSKITSVNIGSSVTDIGSYAFYRCSSLTSVTIGNGVTTIGSYAFYDCSSLTSITISDSVTSIGERAFYNCSSLTSVTIPGGVTSIGSYAFSGCSSLTSVTIPDGVTSIDGYTFYGCSSLTSVVIPDSVTSIGSYAFYRCSSLTSITIPDGITVIGSSAFYYCSGLTSITIPDSVTSIGERAFYGCSSLTSTTLPDSVTSIGSAAFRDCSSLNAVHITDIAAWCNISFNGSYSNPLYYAGNLYLNGELVTELLIPDTVTNISKYAFYGCQSLESVKLPSGITCINDYTFSGCSNLEKVYIHDSVANILTYAFLNCENLKRLVVPESVASIGYNAFSGCGSLTMSVMPGSYAKTYAENNSIPYMLTDTSCEHKNTELKFAATLSCTSEGYTGDTYCSDCDMLIAQGESIPKAHSFAFISKINPTCADAGYDIYSCFDCNEMRYEKLAPIGHKNNFSYQEPASHTEPARNVYVCETCGEESFSYFGFALCDFDKNGLINESDYTAFEGSALTEAEKSAFDFDRSGDITAFDKIIIKRITLGAELQMVIDLNGDGESNLLDFVALKKLAAGESSPSSDSFGGDFDSSGAADSGDIAFARRFILLVLPKIGAGNNS